MSSTVQSSLIEQLQKQCRFWKRLAVTALSVLFLGIIFGYVAFEQQAAYYRDKISESEASADEAAEERPNVMDEPIEPPVVPGTKK